LCRQGRLPFLQSGRDGRRPVPVHV
jgi:hypothetical protein